MNILEISTIMFLIMDSLEVLIIKLIKKAYYLFKLLVYIFITLNYFFWYFPFIIDFIYSMF